MIDWNPDKYGRFEDVRLQPAQDLIARIEELPAGDIVDLGCGNGAVAPDIKRGWPDRILLGVDTSQKMLAKAAAQGVYNHLDQADIARWSPAAPLSMIFSNAALQWLPDHETLLPRLAGQVVSGGVLAVQMPYQHVAMSHMGWSEAEEASCGQKRHVPTLNVLTPQAYFDLLSPLGQFHIWQTTYYQHLAPAKDGHPVRLFTESTYGRPFLEPLDETKKADLIEAYETIMAREYPLRSDGSVLFPFRRLFFTLRLT